MNKKEKINIEVDEIIEDDNFEKIKREIDKKEGKEIAKELAKVEDVDLSTFSDEQLMKVSNNEGLTKSEKNLEKAKRKAFREIAKELIGLAPPIKVAKAINKMTPELQVENIDVATAMLQMQIYNALKGDTRAFEIIRDTAGEKPSENINVKSETPIVNVTAEQIQAVIQNINTLAGE